MTDLNGMTLPTCDICVNGQKRKLYGKKKNKVYLHNGDNFQLKFFNPLQERIGVQLSMNGIKVDNDLLVLNPGQEITIERFIGTNRKLTFSAYDIDTSKMSEERVKEATKAIEKNGILDVTFWNEKKTAPIIFTTTTTVPNFTGYPVPNYIPIYTTDSGSITNAYPITSGTSITSNGNLIISSTGDVTINGNLKINGTVDVNNGQLTIGHSGTSGSSGDCGLSGTSGKPGTSGLAGGRGTCGNSGYKSPGMFLSDTDTSYTKFSSIDYAPQELSRGIVDSRVSGNLGMNNTTLSKKIETGRIEKGGVSNQYFSPIAFEVGDPFYQIKFKLLPFSLKPLKKNSMTQQLLKIS